MQSDLEANMPDKTSFVFCLHNHQPEGNFDHILEETYERSYLPMLELLERHPRVKVSQHFTGTLLEWLDATHPDFLDRYRELVERGQVEFLSGAFYEPILCAIPDRDKVGQIRKMNAWLTDRIGSPPAPGMWVAERVWEPHFPAALAEAGIRFLPLDDAHFKINGLHDEQLTGPYVTEEQGADVIVFPTSERLRYLIPFDAVEKAIDHIRSFASPKGENVLVMADDGEKFGIWPGTYTPIWEEGWLEQFFTQLEAHADVIETMHFMTYLERHRPRGNVYLPTASYREMMTWALHAEDSCKLDELLHEREGLDEEHFLRGGFWRNFLVKYPESNAMHKKMLWLGERIEALPEDEPLRTEAQQFLWRGQCNCGYWHGVFGGLYLNHIRSAVYENLIGSQALIEEAVHRGKKHWYVSEVGNLLKDGSETFRAANPELNLLFNLSQGGNLIELDLMQERFNVLNTLTRRTEAYHKKLLEQDIVVRKSMDEAISIHDIAVAKEEGLAERLYKDWYRRTACIDHFFGDEVELEAFRTCQYPELGDFVNQPYEIKVDEKATRVSARLRRDGHLWPEAGPIPVRVEKTVKLPRDGRKFEVFYTVTNRSQERLSTRFGSEWGFSMNAGHTWDRCYRIPDTELEDNNLDSIGEIQDAQEIGLVEGWLKFEMKLTWDRPALLWRFPLETISNSEGGFERVYQSSVVTPVWPLELEPGASWKVLMSVEAVSLE